MTSTSSPSSTPFVARSAVDLIALVPVVLGFHPVESVVLLTFGRPGRSFHARVDLHPGSEDQEAVADVLASAVRSNGIGLAAVLLYGADEQVCRAQGERVVTRLLALGCDIADVLRVHDGRWFPVPQRGSPGTAYDLETHRFTAQHVFEGRVVHRDRASLAETLVGTDPDDATAVALAATRYADLVLATDGDDLLRTEARWLQQVVRSRVDGDRSALTPAMAGRLLVLASLVPTRDVAWAEIDRERAGGHVTLWRDLLRRAPRQLVPGVGSLLAFAAWQHGDGALAWCAVDRVLEVEPDYSMAHLVARALEHALAPSAWQPFDPAGLPVLGDTVPDASPDASPDDSRRDSP